jgi:hypothetical protein
MSFVSILPSINSFGALTEYVATCLIDSSTGLGKGIHYLQLTSNSITYQTRINPSILTGTLQCVDIAFIDSNSFLTLLRDPTSTDQTYKLINLVVPTLYYYSYMGSTSTIYVYEFQTVVSTIPTVITSGRIFSSDNIYYVGATNKMEGGTGFPTSPYANSVAFIMSADSLQSCIASSKTLYTTTTFTYTSGSSPFSTLSSTY